MAIKAEQVSAPELNPWLEGDEVTTSMQRSDAVVDDPMGARSRSTYKQLSLAELCQIIVAGDAGLHVTSASR